MKGQATVESTPLFGQEVSGREDYDSVVLLPERCFKLEGITSQVEITLEFRSFDAPP